MRSARALGSSSKSFNRLPGGGVACVGLERQTQRLPHHGRVGQLQQPATGPETRTGLTFGRSRPAVEEVQHQQDGQDAQQEAEDRPDTAAARTVAAAAAALGGVGQ